MNGAFYGTTAYGGYANSTNCMGGCGTVFEFDPATQKLTTLYTFNGTTDVGGPYVGLAFDTKGNLYGTTEGGDNANNSNGGAVFELTPSTNGSTPWSYSTLHTFNETTDNADGGISSRLVLDKNGNIYATTKYGGNSNCSCGTVYRLDAGTWKLTTLHTFTGGADGGSPNGLAIYYLGTGSFTLYGTTNKGGGAGNAGTVFALDPETQALTTLHAFTGGADGGEPDGLIVDAAGNLYGATLFGGAAGRFDGATSIGGIASGCASVGGCGVGFKLTPPAAGQTAWTETVLHAFTGGADGGVPSGAAFDSKGALYGTTVFGGDLAVCSNNRGFLNLPANPPPGCGVVFKLIQGVEK
jgi:uncharacterized repeat protein (TIGR03803 family)